MRIMHVSIDVVSALYPARDGGNPCCSYGVISILFRSIKFDSNTITICKYYSCKYIFYI